ncbi:MAG: deoxyribonuclease IV [Lentisphaeria bacterium]|jgi:deoxyribonuclease-4
MTAHHSPYLLPRPLGAHLSIRGGFTTAVQQAMVAGADAVQIFTKSQLRWQAAPIPAAAAEAFRAAVAKAKLRFLCAHDSYLINLASGSPESRQKSIESLAHELRRAELLGCACLVLHPGSPKEDSREAGIERVADGLKQVLAATAECACKLALENTAGQGATLGTSFAEIAAMIRLAGAGPRLGVCLDTCHAFAAGYELRTPAAAAALAAEFDREIGLGRLLLLHLNDSKKPLASKVDRHEHIGQGCIGLDGFRSVLREPAFRGIPGILETPKDEDDPELREDRANLARLRECEEGAE